MSLLTMESFDHLQLTDLIKKGWTLWPGSAGDPSGLLAGGGRHGSSCLSLKNAVNVLSRAYTRVYSGTNNTMIMGFALNPVTPFTDQRPATGESNDNGESYLFKMRYLTFPQVYARINTSGTISLLRSNVVLGTTSVALTQGVFTFVEILVTVHATAGAIGVRFNNTQVLTVTGINTRGPSASADLWDEVRIGPNYTGNSGGFADWRFDDFYLCDGAGAAPYNTYLGDNRVDALFPTGVGANVGWTPNPGTLPNWDAVNDPQPNDDTDYVEAATVGLTDTHIFQDAPVGAASILAIQPVLALRKSDAGPCTVAPVARHGGTDYAGAGLSPGTSYTLMAAPQTVNPATGVAWTVADFNAAEFGYRRTL